MQNALSTTLPERKISVDLRSIMGGGKISGVENYLINVLKRLDQRANIEGFYNSYSEASFPFLPTGMALKRTRYPNKIFNLLLTFFKQPRFEKLYAPLGTVWMPDLRPFALKRSSKLAITVHDLSPVVHPELYSLKMRIWHRLIRHKQAFKRADLILAVSEYTKKDLINICGVPPENIHVVYPGIDHEVFKPDLDENAKREMRRKYELPEKFILSISTIEPRKNILTLIKSFEQLGNGDVDLVIAGKLGWVYKSILQAVNNSPKKDRIRLIGYVDEKDKALMIASAKIVCYPSYYEGFGFVPLEAMACGVPAISSARTSMPEVCGDAALLVEPYQQTDLVNALNALLNDRVLREEMIQKGLQRARMFTWDKCAEEIQNYLTELGSS